MSQALTDLRDFQRAIAHALDLTPVTIQAWGRAMNISGPEFTALLDAAELGEAVANVTDLIQKRDNHG